MTSARGRVWRGMVCGLALLPPMATGASNPLPASSLDRGYHDAYNLDFNSAEKEFKSWESEHPADPIGPVSEAAGILFSELDRLGVLEAQFYQKDSSFLNRPKVSADPAKKAAFNAAVNQAESKAQQALARDPKNNDALFTMALVNGLRADYASLVEKRDMAG